jgi:hypothetical protein
MESEFSGKAQPIDPGMYPGRSMTVCLHASLSAGARSVAGAKIDRSFQGGSAFELNI